MVSNEISLTMCVVAVDPAMDQPRPRLVAISLNIHSANNPERKKEESEKAKRKEWVLI